MSRPISQELRDPVKVVQDAVQNHGKIPARVASLIFSTIIGAVTVASISAKLALGKVAILAMAGKAICVAVPPILFLFLAVSLALYMDESMKQAKKEGRS